MESSEKETRAIFLNFKEVRSLEKNVKSLDLEKAYNISLINLDQKVVKVKYKHLKDKVSKIKSHLPPEELEKMKMLEEEGKLNIKIPESDLRLKITAAERRLKLMPRAKSALPRLQSESVTEKKPCAIKTHRSSQKLKFNPATPRPKTSAAPVSPSVQKENNSNRPVSARVSKPDEESNYLCPRTVRNERRKSIFCTNDELNALNALKAHAPTINVVNAVEDSNSDTNSSVGSKRKENHDAAIASSDVSSKNPTIISDAVISAGFEENNENGSNSSLTADREIASVSISSEVPNGSDKDDRDAKTPIAVTTDEENPNELITISVPKLQLEDLDTDHQSENATKKDTVKEVATENIHANETQTKKAEKPRGFVNEIGNKSENCKDKMTSTLKVPSQSPANSARSNGNNQSTKNRLRPMSVPATQITNFNQADKKARPKTAIELAVETRKQSIMDIRRASSLLKEGKTRSPFSCHEAENEEKREKPFRSIREGANTANNDSEIFDNTLGDDLHKEMKKGMKLGEVATSLYLEDKIDHFLERVDNYVKENPNYVFDPDAPKKRVPRVTKDKKARPKRNMLRRRHLERQLQEADVEEMKKSRWLREDDDNLDSTGVTTLVIDQMKMLNRIKHPYDDNY